MFVYKLTLPDETAYIGSCKDIAKRLRVHKCRAKTTPAFQKISGAIARVGFENVKIEVLAVLETRELAQEFEKNAIRVARIAGVSLLNFDGVRNWIPGKRQVSQKRMSEIAYKAWQNPETRAQLVRAARRRSLGDPDAMRERQKKATLSRIEKGPVIAVYSKDGDLIVKTKSTSKVASILKVKQSSVCRYVRNERKPRNFVIEVLS